MKEVERRFGGQELLLSDEVLGQEPKTITDWQEASEVLLATSAYREFERDRKNQQLLSVLAIKAYFSWARKRLGPEIDHPWFYPSIVKGVILWLGWATQKEPTEAARFAYTLLGQEKVYGTCHALHNTGILPEGIDPSYRRKAWGFLPIMVVPREAFTPERRWVSNDRRARLELVAKMSAHLGHLAETQGLKRLKVLDVGGGNAETACLLAQTEGLPPGVLIVVREIDPKMIAEGREKVCQLKEKGKLKAEIVFIQGSAEVPYQEEESRLLRKYERRQKKGRGDTNESELALLAQYREAPVVGAMSAFTMGAMHTKSEPNKLAKTIAVQMCRDLVPGGLALIVDFGDPDLDRKRFLTQTGEAGQTYCLTRPFLESGLRTCFQNWGHLVNNVIEARRAVERAGFWTETSWRLRTLTLIPLPPGLSSYLPLTSEEKNRVQDGERLVCLPLPGYAEMTLEIKS